MRLKSNNLICAFCAAISVGSLYFYWSQCYRYEYLEDNEYFHYNSGDLHKKDWHKTVVVRNGLGGIKQEYDYGPSSPLIFIGGFPRSGTTLMRAMLDAHPDVRCGEETRVVPRILGLRAQWKRSEKEKKRLEEAGVSDDVLDSAITAFLLEIIVKHGAPARRFCNKDPFAFKSTQYLSHLFPNAKFVLMLRDGRAVIHSVISRKVTITGFDLTNYRTCLQKWNDAVSMMYHQCYLVGPKICMPVYYEQLVLEPEKWLKEIAKFLNLSWNESMLHHETFIGKEIKLSKVEKSSDQVIKPVYKEAMTKWVGHIPEDIVRDMATVAPMLAQLGYDPKANPPNYASPSDIIVNGDNLYQPYAANFTDKINQQ